MSPKKHSKAHPDNPWRGAVKKPIRKLVVPTKEEWQAAFRKMDTNGNGCLSLAEIDKGIVDLFPDYNHKPALMRAYKATDKSGDDYIEKGEFGRLLHFLVYFEDLWEDFHAIDADGDRRLDRDEFMKGAEIVGHHMSRKEASEEFDKVDENHGGIVLFDEFCRWAAHRHFGVGFAPDDEAVVEATSHC